MVASAEPWTSRPTLLFETRRLRLRPFVEQDVEALSAILGDPETMRFYPRPFRREETLAWIRQNVQRYEQDGQGLWRIVLLGSGELVGDCGPVKRMVDGVEEVELGWHVHLGHQRRGIATEAATACRDYAFGALGLTRLISLIRPENVPSRRVAEKIGMAVEKETTHGSLELPHLVYAVSRPNGQITISGPSRN